MTSAADNTPEFPSPSRISLLETRQARLLAELEVITYTHSTEEELTDRLREEFNAIVDEKDELVLGVLPDPMIALPRDIWPDIIEYVVGDDDRASVLLDLTMVSQSWFLIITSFPTLWSYIRLDHKEEDYLAKTATCLHFSRSCDLALDIRLSIQSWQEFSALILPESSRIYSLSLNPEDPRHDLEIIAEFDLLPSLEELLLPCRGRQVLSDAHIAALRLERMPILQEIWGPLVSIRSRPWSELVSYPGIEPTTGERNFITAYGESPDLQDLLEEVGENKCLEELPNPLEPSLPLLGSFYYEGPALTTCMEWMGQDLVELELGSLTISDFHTVIGFLPQLDSLDRLSLALGSWEGDRVHIPDSQTQPSSRISINSLTLDFSPYPPSNPYPEDSNVMEALLSLFMALTSTITGAEELRFTGLRLESEVLTYIQRLDSLRDLVLTDCALNITTRPISLSVPCMESFGWSGGYNFLHILVEMHCPLLHVLSFHVNDGLWKYQDNFPTYLISPNSFPVLTSLSITIESPVLWDIGLHPHLRELELRTAHGNQPSLIFAGDLFEYLIMKPRNLPALDTIILRGDYLEWDILILMLERRNMLLQPELSPIKAIVVDRNISYKLLYPLATLLQGKLPKRAPLGSFSIENIGQRLWDDNFLGCSQCIYAFRECDNEVIAGRDSNELNYIENMLFEADYKLPSQYLAAEPPLTPAMGQWLAGKRQRRLAFVQGCKASDERFHRNESCSLGRIWGFRPVTICGHSLDGVDF